MKLSILNKGNLVFQEISIKSNDNLILFGTINKIK